MRDFIDAKLKICLHDVEVWSGHDKTDGSPVIVLRLHGHEMTDDGSTQETLEVYEVAFPKAKLEPISTSLACGLFHAADPDAHGRWN